MKSLVRWFTLLIGVALIGMIFIKVGAYRSLPAPLYYQGEMHFLSDVKLLVNCRSGHPGIESLLNEMLGDAKSDAAGVWDRRTVFSSKIDDSLLDKRRNFFSKINSIDIFCSYRMGDRYFSMVTVFYGENNQPITTFFIFEADPDDTLFYVVNRPLEDDGFTNAVGYWWEYAKPDKKDLSTAGFGDLFKLIFGEYSSNGGVGILNEFSMSSYESESLDDFAAVNDLYETLTHEMGVVGRADVGGLSYFMYGSGGKLEKVEPTKILPFPKLMKELVSWPKATYLEKWGDIL